MDISGTVRDESSGEGVGGVAVSNGESIAQTGVDGSYTLPFRPEEHAFVWVTRPDDHDTVGPFYKTPLELEQTAEFRLVRVRAPGQKRLRMAQVTDFHFGRHCDDPESLRADLRHVVATHTPDFAVISGDLTDLGTEDQLRRCRAILEDSGLTFFPMFGGHDGFQERKSSERGTTCTRTYEGCFGPAYYSFDRGGRHFVLFPNEDRYFSATDVERKRTWLRADLKIQPPGRSTVLFVHATPPQTFVEELADLGVEMLLFGHRHSNKWYESSGVQVGCCPALCFGGTDYSARGYRIVDFGSKTATTRLASISSVPSRSTHRVAGSTRGRILLPGLELSRTWEHQMSGGLHRTALVSWRDAILVAMDDQYGGDPGLRCIDVASGATRWEVETETGIQVAPGVEGGCCVAITPPGRLYGVDARTGEQQWTADLPGYPERWIYSSPAVCGAPGSSLVYAGSNAGWGAFDGATGTSLWYSSFVGDATRIIDKPSGTNGLIIDDRLILLIPKRGLVALDRHTGQQLWERILGVHHYWATPILAGEEIVTGGDHGVLAVLRVDNGAVQHQWKLLEGEYPTGLASKGDRLFVAMPNGTVCAIRLEDGELLWSFATGKALVDMVPTRRGGSSVLAPPFPWMDWLLVPGSDGILHILDPATGSVAQQIDFGAPLTATPCAVEDGLCIPTLDGRITYLTP